jgi:hypothetical protein
LELIQTLSHKLWIHLQKMISQRMRKLSRIHQQLRDKLEMTSLNEELTFFVVEDKIKLNPANGFDACEIQSMILRGEKDI